MFLGPREVSHPPTLQDKRIIYGLFDVNIKWELRYPHTGGIEFRSSARPIGNSKLPHRLGYHYHHRHDFKRRAERKVEKINYPRSKWFIWTFHIGVTNVYTLLWSAERIALWRIVHSNYNLIILKSYFFATQGLRCPFQSKKNLC